VGSTTNRGLGEALKVSQRNKNISKAFQSFGLGTDPLGISKQMRMDTKWFRTFCLYVCCIKKQLIIEGAINLPVVLYACEDWFFLLRVEHRLTLSRFGVFRKKFELQRKEVTGRRRKL
jgi:hypothetical protein